jgi:predicted O-methyltransferase YrrM
MCGLLASSFAQPPRGRGPGRAGPPNPLLRVFDTDRDGQLSAKEIESAADSLKQLDTSEDGSLSEDELQRAVPLVRRPFGPSPRRGQPEGSESDLEKDPLAKDEHEQKVLATLQEMWQGDRYLNVSPSDGRLLRMLAESTGAKRVVEIGTSTGESALWLALALRRNGGHLWTHEIDPGRAEAARRNFQKAGVGDTVTVIEGDAHETVRQHKPPIDILFLDADKEGYIDYLDKLLPHIRPGGLVIAHNMNTRQADPRYVKAITENPELETLILLKEGTGVGVTLKKR